MATLCWCSQVPSHCREYHHCTLSRLFMVAFLSSNLGLILLALDDFSSRSNVLLCCRSCCLAPYICLSTWTAMNSSLLDVRRRDPLAGGFVEVCLAFEIYVTNLVGCSIANAV